MFKTIHGKIQHLYIWTRESQGYAFLWSLNVLVLILPRHFPAFHLSLPIFGPVACILRWQKQRTGPPPRENIARTTIQHRLRRLDSRSGDSGYAVTERARAAQAGRAEALPQFMEVRSSGLVAPARSASII
jgi:hypothetical protein